MEPGAGEDGRDVRRCVEVRPDRIERFELLGVPLLHPAETPKLAFHAVEITMMVGVAGDEAVAADAIEGLDPLDHVNGERELGDPRRAGELVGEIELGGRYVMNPGFGAEVVDRFDQQVRLLPAHQVDVAQRPARVARQR